MAKEQQKSSSLWRRTLSGIILVVLTVEMTLWREWSFYLLWGAVGFLCLWEYYKVLGQAFHGKNKEGKPVASVVKHRIWYLLFGTAYILTPIVLLTRLDPAMNWEFHNGMMVVTLLFIVWMNDTGAYLVGVSIGKHKMTPKISPKKSWEGFFGGLLFGVGTALAMYALYWRPETSSPEFDIDEWIPKVQWLGFGLVVSLAGVGGDLIESKFKRTLGIKDSGKMIPGHGGMLDRFDALLMAIPVAWIYIRLTGMI